MSQIKFLTKNSFLFHENRKKPKKCNKKCKLKKEEQVKHEPDCQLNSYRVNFTDIGWSEWVQHPEGFDMGFCNGSCAHNPIPLQYEPTNHAIFQQLYHSRGLGVHPPCCIPIGK